MKKHTKLYFEHFGYDQSSFVPCEVCAAKANAIHHIDCRGMGGTKKPENIENLMAVCQVCHIKYGDKKQYVSLLLSAHQTKLNASR